MPAALPVIVTRPEGSADATVARARAMGLTAHAVPLFRVEPREWRAPPAEEFDALLLTSANAMAHAGEGLDAYRTLPVLAVGDATARAAETAGLRVALVGSEGVAALLARPDASRYRRLLHLAGRHRTSLSEPSAIAHSATVYDAVAVPIDAAGRRLLSRPAVVTLFSARAGRALSDVMAGVTTDVKTGAALECARISIAAISDAAADAAGAGWARVAVARRPAEDALLDCARSLCDGHPREEPRGAPPL